ncbi:MAG: gliding motility-associated C-terminal domain-containing protein [Bacteroidetes bacterium]|nr:gliding motility-associated C-terminal domain-containing protein [Bacteroidota bacterium]
MPDSTVSASGLYLDNGAWYTKFACINCPSNYRLNIHISNTGETILFGLKAPGGFTFNLKKPNGTIALTGICPYATGQTGYIRYFRQAMIGPFPQSSGYIPLSYQVTSIADTGDYYFEIINPPSYGLTIDYWDFQVVSGQHSPPVQTDTINGRVWSKSWQLYADLGNFVFQPFNGKFFVYSDDRIVTKLAFSNAHVGAVTIFCNPYGCLNSGIFNTDRRSININTSNTFTGIAQYKVFLNNPDSIAYPSGGYGQITGNPYMIPDPAYSPCSRYKQIVVSVNKAGVLETTLTFPYGAPATTIDFYSPVLNGTNDIPWNGLDGLGNPVPNGTLITVQLNYVNGLTNLPIWDQERNPDGYQISLVRPGGSSMIVPMTYWDDSQLTTTGSLCPVAPQTTNFTGCTPGSIPGYPGCHPWGLNQADCHDKMINTWWYSSASTALFTAVFTTTPPEATGHDSTRCGPGTVELSATVPPGLTVDWYDSITGGNLLLQGSPAFVTPFLSVTTIYYAETRDTIDNCHSTSRTPVIAIILPLTFPEINGPAYVCEASGEQVYTTQAGMLNYQWSVSAGGQIISGQGTNSIAVSWTGPGTESVSVSFTNPNGCVPPRPGSFHVFVGKAPGPAGPIDGPAPLCIGAVQVVFSVAPIPDAAFYIWTLPPGLVITAGSGTNFITVNVPQGSASGTIMVHAVNRCGTGLPSPPFTLIINEPALVFAGTDDTLCQGSSFTLIQATAHNFSSLLWTTSGQGSFSDPAMLNPVYSPAQTETGPIIITLIGYAFPPCPNDTSELTLYYTPKPSADAGENALICGRTTYPLTTSSAFNYNSLQWTTSGNGTFSDTHILHPQYFPSTQDIQADRIILTLNAAPIPPCEAVKDSMLITFIKAPTASAGTGSVICGGTPFVVTDARASDYTHIHWTHNGKGSIVGDTTLQPVYTPFIDESGEVILTMQVNGSGPCNDSAVFSQLTIRVYTGVEVYAGPDQLIPDSSSTFLTSSVQGGSGNFSYTWEPSSLLINPADPNPETQLLTADTTFILTVKDLHSICSGRDSLRVKMKKLPPPPPPTEDCILVHNVITPNGDGLNDKLIIDCIEIYPDNSIQFFTRWGVMVRSFEHYDNKTTSWDGTNDKGEPLPDGTYYYVLTIKNLGTRTGWVFIRDGSR